MATLLVVTGASRGFGRCLLTSFLVALPGKVTAIIMGRNASSLDESAKLGKEVNSEAVFIPSCFDMADLDAIQPAWEAALALASSAAGEGGFTRAILINNSGSLGDTCYMADLPALASLKAAVDSNVTATVWLTSLFLKWLQGPCGPSSPAGTPPSLLINVSSLAAIKPFPTQLVYCIGKAARDMLHAGVAEELSQAAEAGKLRCPVKSLNYAPGPLDTDMQSELRGSGSLHAGTREYFVKIKAEGTLIKPEDSAAKCVRIVAEDKYASGAHVDFYDPYP